MPITLEGQVNLLENPPFAPGKAVKNQIASIQGVNLVKMVLQAGSSLPSHHVDKAAFAVLLKGKATFPINEKRHEITTGAFLEIPKNAEHSITAQEDSVFLVGIIGPVPEGEC